MTPEEAHREFLRGRVLAFTGAPGELRDGSREEDHYQGGTGWVVIAESFDGHARVIDFWHGFGALRYAVEHVGSHCEDLGMDEPDSPGLFRVNMRVCGPWDDLTFSAEGEWESLWEPDARELDLRCTHRVLEPGGEPLTLPPWEEQRERLKLRCVICGRFWDRSVLRALREEIRTRYRLPHFPWSSAELAEEA